MSTLPVVSSSPKRSANLSLSADVLDAAKALRINVSQVCDRHLREVVRQAQRNLAAPSLTLDVASCRVRCGETVPPA